MFEFIEETLDSIALLVKPLAEGRGFETVRHGADISPGPTVGEPFVAINNAIILVDFIEANVASGQDLREAVAQAGRARMRPIILTTLTTIGGLLPLSLFGGALFAPMTNGMIFGLAVSTVLTLFVIPSLYVLVFQERGKTYKEALSQ